MHMGKKGGGVCVSFRNFQYTIYRGMLWAWKKRMWMNLDVPIHRKPHLTRRGRREEADRVEI